MEVILKSDFEVSDAGCKASTGKTLQEWFALIEANTDVKGRRDVIQWIYNETGRGKDVWWPTTIWVEYERAKGIVNKKDGLGEGYHLCCTKSVNAPIEAVYAAWMDNASWLGANTPSEGAAYEDDGGNTGTWVRLRPGKDLRMTWLTKGVSTPTQVDPQFTDTGKGKTGINVNHARIQTRDEADGLRTAWADALNRLKAQLED